MLPKRPTGVPEPKSDPEPPLGNLRKSLSNQAFGLEKKSSKPHRQYQELLWNT
jgi:hypothetical protein